MKTLANSLLPVVTFNRAFAGLTLKRIILAFQVARERRALRDLTSAQMKDIGIDPAHAQNEASRTFWDLPAAR